MNTEKYQRLYVTTISIHHKIGEIVFVILHIYGARVIFLLFCNHKENESESQEMEIGVAGPIFTYKNTKGYMKQQYRHHTI